NAWLAADGPFVYLCGGYQVGLVAVRSGVAAFDATTGALADWFPGFAGPNARVFAAEKHLFLQDDFGFANGKITPPLQAFGHAGAPIFLTQPGDQTLPAGGTILLSATA